MEEIYFEKTSELKRNLTELQKKLKVEIKLQGKKAVAVGDSIDEYEASLVLEAISFGFSAKKSLLLKDPEMIFRKLQIKNFTKRKNLKEVRARIIGTKGKTKKTIEEISGCYLILKDNELGIIASVETIEEATLAITNLIKGTKQSNVYRYLERTNKIKKEESLELKN